MTDEVDAHEFGGDPDGFERLWTPHRLAYVKSDKPAGESRGCPLCRKAEEDDRAALVVHRGEHCYVVLNLYPYNPGHLMVCPYRHVAMYTEITDAERDEMSVLTQRSMTLLERSSGPQGFNIGMNQGRVGGAGISAHLHQHIVPRWEGDANFLPIIGRTKALPELLDDTWQRLSAAFREDR
nr:HIT domain-containing protein [Demequina pelophila]